MAIIGYVMLDGENKIIDSVEVIHDDKYLGYKITVNNESFIIAILKQIIQKNTSVDYYRIMLKISSKKIKKVTIVPKKENKDEKYEYNSEGEDGFSEEEDYENPFYHFIDSISKKTIINDGQTIKLENHLLGKSISFLKYKHKDNDDNITKKLTFLLDNGKGKLEFILMIENQDDQLICKSNDWYRLI